MASLGGTELQSGRREMIHVHNYPAPSVADVTLGVSPQSSHSHPLDRDSLSSSPATRTEQQQDDQLLLWNIRLVDFIEHWFVPVF